MARLLVICDSRGARLQSIIHELGQTKEIHIVTYKGAGYCDAIHRAKTIIQDYNPAIIIMLLGICDMTKRDSRTKITDLQTNTAQQIVENVMKQARKSLALLGQMGDYHVSYATVTGIDLFEYNRRAKYLGAHTGDKDSIKRQQLILNQAVLETNRKIVELNTELNQPTTWTAGYVHRYFRKKHHYYYNRLSDGCHPTQEAARYWVTQVIKAFDKIKETKILSQN